MDPIAVVGLGCVLPGALDVAAFWRNVLRRQVSLQPVPPQAWEHARYFDADRSAPDRTYCRVGGFVTDFRFDWRRFKVPPADAQAVNPMQWMVLEAGYQALSPLQRLPTETTAIILGSTGLGWQRDSGLRIRLDDMVDAVRDSEAFRSLPPHARDAVLEQAQRELTARLKEVSEDNVVGASASVAAGRINMHFDLKGPHYSVDAGFASSLAALDLAVRGLRDREFDLALTGGVSEMLTPLELIAFSKLGALSEHAARPFAADADGTVLGEGAAMLALKRLDDALADQDTIYAVLRGVGGSSDGRGKSLVAPRFEGQALAMRNAFRDAGDEVRPESIAYVECHATGTHVGDASEVRALREVYGAAAQGSIALGAVKANIGHLRSASGAAGLLKAVLALHHRTVPPHVPVAQVSPGLELSTSPFYLPDEPKPFREGALPRAALSAFSFGGNNFHAVLEARAPSSKPRAARPLPREEPLAVVGMGGMFPGAETIPAFWERLVEGYDRTQRVPKERYAIERYFDPNGARSDKSYTTLGCFLDRLPPPQLSMKIPPSAWSALDPSHVLCLLSAQQALEDAKFVEGKWPKDKVALSLAFLPYQGKKFLADSRVNFAEFHHALAAALEAAKVPAAAQARVLAEAEARFKSGLPEITDDTLTGYLGSLNAGRIAWLHDFHGPHFVVDAACASAHAALHAAWKMLQHRVADVTLTGGVWCDMRPEFFIAACRFNALSADGSFPFDSRANGFIPGEGAGVLVLKRLSDAERDGDRIRAVIRSVRGSSDGKGRSVLAPSREGEALAMKRTLQTAQLSPQAVDYVECHGTGTALGDVVEANAVADVYGPGREQPMLIGSVKSNIGHLNAAAGVAGFAKVILSLEHGVLPASLKVESPNPKLPAGVSVARARQDWPRRPEGGPRRAGVSSFGVGGANFHALFEEYRPATRSLARAGEPSALFAFAGADVAQCLSALEAVCASGAPAAPPPAPGAVRLAVTAGATAELQRKAAVLRRALQMSGPIDFLAQSGIFLRRPNGPLEGGKVVVMFPGQGGQYPNMLRALSGQYPVVAELLHQADAHYARLTGRALTQAFFTDDPGAYQQRDEDIHAAVFLVNLALNALLEAHGVHADFFLGQSAGELAALVAAGALSLEDGLFAIHARTRAVLSIQTDDPGRMVAVSAGAEQVRALLRGLPGYCALAADNGPKACIVSADRQALPVLLERLTAQGLEHQALAVSHGYHSALIAAAQGPYRQALEGLSWRAPRRPIVSTVDGEPYGDKSPSQIIELLTRQFVEPVLLQKAFRTAHRLGARFFIEAGPKWSLTQFARESLAELPHAAMATIHPKVGELEQWNRLLGFSFVHGLGPARPVKRGVTMQTQLRTSASVGPPASAEEALLSLPLAEVLGSDAARRIASALGRRFAVDAAGARAEDVATLEAVVAYVARGGKPSASAPTSEAARVVEEARFAAAAWTAETAEAEVHRVLLANAVEKTGYPPEMLELDLDLEADLGVDTVKQVAIFSKTREHFGLTRDPKLSLRDFNTLRKVIVHLRDRLLLASPPAVPAGTFVERASAMPKTQPSSPSASRPAVSAEEIRRVLLANAVEKTGYPEEMLELDLDLEADLGVDTVKQVAIFAKTREHFGVPRDPKLSLRDFNTLRKVITHLDEKIQAMGGAAPPSSSAGAASGRSSNGANGHSPGGRGGGPASLDEVRSALLSMQLIDELGLTPEETAKLARALADRLGLPSLESGGARTLNDLITLARQSQRPT